jgi:hypothetical protein
MNKKEYNKKWREAHKEQYKDYWKKRTERWNEDYKKRLENKNEPRIFTNIKEKIKDILKTPQGLQNFWQLLKRNDNYKGYSSLEYYQTHKEKLIKYSKEYYKREKENGNTKHNKNSI